MTRPAASVGGAGRSPSRLPDPVSTRAIATSCSSPVPPAAAPPSSGWAWPRAEGVGREAGRPGHHRIDVVLRVVVREDGPLEVVVGARGGEVARGRVHGIRGGPGVGEAGSGAVHPPARPR